MWRILCTICVTSLWIQRNRVVHQGGRVSQESSVREFRQAAGRHLRALAKRERRKPHTMVQGIRLLLCLDMYDCPLHETPQQVVSHVRPPGSLQTPALISWLRTYQTSCI
ncbi:hypothetical protein PHYSODRAFT_527327 [Phytophthora sojae]|uniref:Uncharacterized protein n=1 Tax=Phytophthora sojae (strain P6497) TaxID=1094619 RepID=G5A8R1_PHYSP|nr:hypothetical protein PHYSODRAFT_527327 [Phytophthora sojae]EGZ08287.1 hypothetical protein PHYSODRAFT_527327 [Phytophthora sojae]|eukprot:XP_009536459.1 hypothetical protein PHYSODRAFT_527327 [Phytophthora sojae]